jgi:hypothetical protein
MVAQTPRGRAFSGQLGGAFGVTFGDSLAGAVGGTFRGVFGETRSKFVFGRIRRMVPAQ